MEKEEKGQVKDATIETLEHRVRELEILVKFYEEQFRLSKKRQFGASSEKSEYDQLSLDTLGGSEVVGNGIEDSQEPELALIKEHYRKKRTRKDSLPENIPVEEILCELPQEEQICPDCGSHLQVMGHESRSELVVIPAKVMIRKYVTCTYSCRECAKSSHRVPILKSHAPKPVIKGGFASAEAVAYVAHQKFVMGLPLYRQEQEWKRQGVMLSRQTMANWLIKSAEDWLLPLARELKRQLLCRQVLHADETRFQVLKEPGKKAQSQSWLWCYRTSGDTDEPIVLAEYKPDRKTCNPADFLAGFAGYLHTDGYEAYHKLPQQVVVVGCWAHVRRKWDEALKSVPAKNRENCDAQKGKKYCDELFELEREFAGMDAESRCIHREKQLRPVMNAFFAWAEDLHVLPKSLVGKAVGYMLSQREYLNNVFLDGRLELSNNRAERTVKPFVISRKNFLFANTQRGANAAAILFSLTETAKETGVDPFQYLTHVFKMAPTIDMEDPANLKRLLPVAFRRDHCS
jgi:transposase